MHASDRSIKPIKDLFEISIQGSLYVVCEQSPTASQVYRALRIRILQAVKLVSFELNVLELDMPNKLFVGILGDDMVSPPGCILIY